MSVAQEQTTPMELQEQYISSQPWAAAVQSLHLDMFDQISTALPVVPQPTQHAPSGVLEVPSLEPGKGAFVLHTFTGGPTMPHLYRSTAVVPPMGMILMKVGAHANMDKGTPFLNIELAGNERQMLIAAMLTPRLNPLQHPQYLDKYWKGVPPGGTEGLKSFVEIEKGMRAATTPYNTASFIGDKAAAAHGHAPAPAPSHGAGSSGDSGQAQQQQQHVYRHFYSSSLWSRVASSTGLTFTFDPTDHAAVERVKADVGALVQLWCGWVGHDAAHTQPLSGQQLHECKQLTHTMANFIEYDEQTAGSVLLFGSEAVGRMKETVSGAASCSSGGMPWWADE